eukprot:6203163-Pleurochrysis_carterae.AAC.4
MCDLQEIRVIFEQIDTSHNGVVDYIEFLGAMVSLQVFVCGRAREWPSGFGRDAREKGRVWLRRSERLKVKNLRRVDTGREGDDEPGAERERAGREVVIDAIGGVV